MEGVYSLARNLLLGKTFNNFTLMNMYHENGGLVHSHALERIKNCY